VDRSTCARCGDPLPSRAKFCPNCGAPVAIVPESERRLVTVLFLDLVGSTKLASQLDPERFREVLAAFHAMVTEEVEWLRGRAESFIGDAVMAVFGVPTSHDDDGVRAIRAALSVVNRAPQLGRELGLPTPLHVHGGINTGLVAVGTAADRGIVIGGGVNIGARLQQAAVPGEVLVGPTTHQLVKDAVEFGEMRKIVPKEFDGEIAAWPVIRLAPRSTRSTIPFVDRRRELALLTDTSERVRERGRAHLVTLLGEPGIGKTRVVDEFLDTLDDDQVTVLSGRPSQYEEQVTFWPLGQMILNAIDGTEDMPSDQLRERLHAAAVGWVGPEDADKVAYRLSLALGLGEDANNENRYYSVEIRRGVLAMIEGLTATGPVVLVFEDLHVGEPLLLDLIERLMRDGRRLPLLVICVARWGFLDERPGWAGGLADAVTLWVEPLAIEDAAQLAMESGDLGREDALRVAEHAGGNPLYIVEITGMLLREEDVLPPTGVAAPATGPLPPTVQAVIASRMDSLSPAARDLVRKASVFARGAFDASELSLVVDPRKDVMAELEDVEFLLPEPGRKDAWRFRSEVLRDVAYESLGKRERQRLHLRVANRLSRSGSAERYPRTIAYHLEQAAIAGLDLNPRDRSIADRAVEALSLAGDLARRRIESRSAADHYEHALALAGPEEHWGDREATILSKLGESLYWLGDYERAEHVLERALSVEGDSDYVLSHASRFLADIILTSRGDADTAAAMFDRSLEAARKLDDPSILARTLLMAGWVPFSRDDLAGARTMFTEALQAARSSTDGPDRWSEVRALVSLSAITSEDGDEVDALALAEEGLEIGRGSGLEFALATAEEKVALALRHLLRLDESLEHCASAIETYRELGARWELAGAIGDRGVIYRLSGRLEDAEAELREAFALCRGLNERGLVTWTTSELMKIQVLRGDLSGAVQTMEDPGSRLAELEADSSTALLVSQAVLALATGDRDAALDRALAAVALEASTRKGRNSHAAQVWWTAKLFGDDVVGGADVVAEAKDLLEAHHWGQALLEPELIETAILSGADAVASRVDDR
jgi:class 3 adenylate cyclase/tetratricopeptide (TPR) repeat protein